MKSKKKYAFFFYLHLLYFLSFNFFFVWLLCHTTVLRNITCCFLFFTIDAVFMHFIYLIRNSFIEIYFFFLFFLLYAENFVWFANELISTVISLCYVIFDIVFFWWQRKIDIVGKANYGVSKFLIQKSEFFKLKILIWTK